MKEIGQGQKNLGCLVEIKLTSDRAFRGKKKKKKDKRQSCKFIRPWPIIFQAFNYGKKRKWQILKTKKVIYKLTTITLMHNPFSSSYLWGITIKWTKLNILYPSFLIFILSNNIKKISLLSFYFPHL